MLRTTARLRNTAKLLGVLAALFSMLALTACGGSDPIPQQKASALTGGALSNFGGTDGSDPSARAIARDIATSRDYDFTPTPYTVASGAASSTGLTGSGYGDGTGSLTMIGNDGTVEMDITSQTSGIHNVALQGTFNPASAQLSIDNPGSSFTVSWTITFDVEGDSFTLTCDQVLSGSGWTQV